MCCAKTLLIKANLHITLNLEQRCRAIFSIFANQLLKNIGSVLEVWRFSGRPGGASRGGPGGFSEDALQDAIKTDSGSQMASISRRHFGIIPEDLSFFVDRSDLPSLLVQYIRVFMELLGRLFAKRPTKTHNNLLLEGPGRPK